MNRFLAPEKLFRVATILLIIFNGIVMSDALGESPHSSRAGYLGNWPEISLLFACVWIFVFFRIQFAVFPRVTKRSLNSGLSYLQLGVCLAAVAYGVGKLHGAIGARPEFEQVDEWAMQVANRTKISCGLLGQVIFATNLIWSHFYGAAVEEVPFKAWVSRLWMSKISAAKQFGWASAFLGIMGVLMLWRGWTSPRLFVAIGDGSTVRIPVAAISIVAALPFALFSLGYWVFSRLTSRRVDESFVFGHLVITLIAVGSLASTFVQSQASVLSGASSGGTTGKLYFGIGWALMSVVFFSLNVSGVLRQSTAKA